MGLGDPAIATDTSNQPWGEVIVEGNADKIKNRLEGELADLVKKWSRRLQGYTLLFFTLMKESELRTRTRSIRPYRALNRVKEKTCFWFWLAVEGT